MRIGIDARFLTHPQRGGFKSYVQTVVSALVEANAAHEFILYTDRPAMPPDLPANFYVRPVTGGNAITREQFALPLAMKRDGLDVAHFPCNTGPMVPGSRMAVTIHDSIPLRNGAAADAPKSRRQRLLRRYWRAMIPRAARTADLIIADSEYVRDDLCVRFGLREDRLRVVPLAINPLFFGDLPGMPPVGINPESPFILAFGSADGRKNHKSAMAAFESVSPDFPNVSMVLICSHSDVRETLPPTDGVIPVGPVSQQELLWLYRNACSLVFPSFDEGFGLPPLEAMACGTPVVVSSAGSLPEIVAEHGVFIDPSDVSSIADGLRRLLADGDLRERLSEAGRAHASRYTLKRMGMDLVGAYEQTVRTRVRR